MLGEVIRKKISVYFSKLPAVCNMLQPLKRQQIQQVKPATGAARTNTATDGRNYQRFVF